MKQFMKWLGVFIASFLVGCILVGTINYVVDPYGAFGDKFLNANSYGLELNPRIMKINYLDKNHDKFNTYIFGGSKVGALLPEDIDAAYVDTGVKSYNMMMTLGEFDSYEKTINYVIDNYDPENIILQLSVLETKYFGESNKISRQLHYKVGDMSQLEYYWRFLKLNLNESFDKVKATINKDEDYDKNANISILTGVQSRTGVIERINTKGEKYYRPRSSFTKAPKVKELKALEENLESLQRIVNKCKENDVNFILMSAPTSNREFEIYPVDQLKDYMVKIADICPYWNFTGYNDISYNYWNFYDANHYRIEVGEMILSKVTGNQIGKVAIEDIPKNFGVYITPENAEKELTQAFTKPKYIVKNEEKFADLLAKDESTLTNQEKKKLKNRKYIWGMTYGENLWG